MLYRRRSNYWVKAAQEEGVMIISSSVYTVYKNTVYNKTGPAAGLKTLIKWYQNGYIQSCKSNMMEPPCDEVMGCN